MGKRIHILIFSSLVLVQSISGESCAENCNTACTAVDGGCSTVCKPGYYGRKCQHPFQCYVGTGIDYMGTKNTTKNNLSCQAWSSKSPNTHTMNIPASYKNFCRKPNPASNDVEPWCYNAASTSPRWEYCGVPECGDQCPAPTFELFGDILNPPDEGFYIGVEVRLLTGCGPGTWGNRTCKGDKTWSSDTNCVDIKWCPKPKLKPRSYVGNVQDEYNFNTELRVYCDTGYDITGSPSTIRCRADKTWGTIPSCTRVQCASPVLNENRTIVGGSNSTYSYGDTITVGCSTGFTAPNQTTYTCGADKTWSGTLPTCQPVSCPHLHLNPHSSIQSGNKSAFVYNDRVKISCEKGYTIQGQETLACQATGQWDSQPPTCNQVKCTKPILSQNEIITSGEKAEYGYRDSVVLRCSFGYSFQGDNRMTCHESGLWLGAGWRCIAVNNDSNSAYMIGGAVGGVIGLMIGAATVLIIVCIRQRKQRSSLPNNGNSENVENDAGQEYINLGSDSPNTEKNAYEVLKKRDSDHVYNELN